MVRFFKNAARRKEVVDANRASIVKLAIAGHSPAEIYQELDDCTLSAIKAHLRRARAAGTVIPYFRQGRRLTAEPRLKPGPSAAPALLTADEEIRLTYLARHNGLTAIAAHMRKPYAVLAEAMTRLGLSRT